MPRRSARPRSTKTRMTLMVCAVVSGVAWPGAVPTSGQPASGIVTTPPRQVSDGAIVRLEYTMRNDAGAVKDKMDMIDSLRNVKKFLVELREKLQ